MKNESNKFDVNLDPKQSERLRELFGFKNDFKLSEDRGIETETTLKNKIKKFFGKCFFLIGNSPLYLALSSSS